MALSADEIKVHQTLVRHARGLLASHEAMLRQARGLLAAYEDWLRIVTHEVDDADPVKVFTEVQAQFPERRKNGA